MEHVISDELFREAYNSLAKNEHWVAYNTISYFLDKPDMFFFKSKEEADEFAINNISDRDAYRVIHAESIDELLKQIPYGESLRIKLFTSKNKSMNETNLAALEKKLTNLGFGDAMNEAMKKNIEEKKPEFNLQHEIPYGGRTLAVDLSFKAGNENEMYFFNKYEAKLDDRAQTFYMDRGNAITTKEAFNLLEGRAVNKDLVNKEGEKYNAWVQLDFNAEKDKYGNHQVNRYHENYNYDLGKEMSQLILKPMSPEEEDKLFNSLSKGNVQSVTFLKEGEEVKGFVEANPKERTINIYDGHMKPLSQEQKKDFLDHEPGKQQKATVKKGGDDLEENAGLKKKRTRKKGNGMSV